MASVDGRDIHKIIIASGGGMGSSVMLTSQLSKQLRQYPVQVQNAPVTSIPEDADVVVCHAGEAAGARGGASGTVVVSFQVFLGDPAITSLVTIVKQGGVLNAPLLNRPHGQHHHTDAPPVAQVGDRVAADRRRTADRSRVAAAIEAAHPGWLVMYGAGAAKLFAFPMWQYTGDAVTVSASTPDELADAISRSETELRVRPL